MKFGRNYAEFSSEVAMLESFNNEVVSILYDVDYENMVFLMEAVEPGEELSKEKNMTVRLDAFSTLHKRLHQEEESISSHNKPSCDYQTYEEWGLRKPIYIKLCILKGLWRCVGMLKVVHILAKKRNF